MDDGDTIKTASAAPASLMSPEREFAQRLAAVLPIARAHADDVDARARFPTEAFEALKAARLLGVMAPIELGGEGASVSDVADLCFKLGRACASTAMIFAMHQVKLACLVRHHDNAPWQIGFLRRVAREQLLLASSTTEGKSGGAIRASEAAVDIQGGLIRLRREATVMSYGEQADAVVTTARRSPDATASDQVLVVFPRETYRLERTGSWETMGMRGTCSLGFALEAEGEPGQILPAPYSDIHAQTMTPTAHLLWTSVWAGVAAEAVERARLFVRRAGRDGGRPPPGAARLVRINASLRTLCAVISDALARYEAIKDRPTALMAIDYQAAVTLLKVEVSEMAVGIVTGAMRTCGLAGYRNDGEFSLSRLLRDILSAPLMINNDRILNDLGAAALIDRAPLSIRPSF
jgi:acyl-CoA dehydrogenase